MVDLRDHQSAIARFRAAHFAADLLVLPTVWDALSALVFEAAGFNAIGTGSQGIAATHGLLDGQHIAMSEMRDSVAHIVDAVSVPVSADLESGYAQSMEDLYEHTQEFVLTGITGCNFEDARSEEGGALYPLAEQLTRIQTVRTAANALERPIFINAVTDAYLTSSPHGEKLATVLERAPAFIAAGADGVYAPGMVEREDIQALVNVANGPVNVLARPGLPSCGELLELGVTRVTFGSGLLRVVSKQLLALASQLVTNDFTPFLEGFWPNDPFLTLVAQSRRL